jgi:hypothetical protein
MNKYRMTIPIQRMICNIWLYGFLMLFIQTSVYGASDNEKVKYWKLPTKAGKSVAVSPPIIKETTCIQELTKSWDRTFGGNQYDNLTAMIKTGDGGYLLGGESLSDISADRTQTSHGRLDYWIVKTDASGNKIWDKGFGGSGNDRLSAMITTADGGYLLGGESDSGISGDKSQASQGNRDYWIVKIDANGAKQWDRRFGGSNDDGLLSLVTANDGGYLLGGYSFSNISGDKSQVGLGTWIVKVDGNGNKMWDKSFEDRYFTSMVTTNDGGYLLGGWSNIGALSDSPDFWVSKISNNGGVIWEKTFGGSDFDVLQSLLQTSDGGYILGGSSSSDISGDKTQPTKGGMDYWIVKIDASGRKLWDRSLGGDADDVLSSIVESNGGYVVGGSSSSGIAGDKTEDNIGGDDYWILKIDKNGNKSWDRTFGGTDVDQLVVLLPTASGGYILGGKSLSNISGDKSQNSKGDFDFWLLSSYFPDCPTQIQVCHWNDVSLTASGCSGTINWSTGEHDRTIIISAEVSVSVTATCTENGVTSSNSNALSIVVLQSNPPTITTRAPCTKKVLKTNFTSQYGGTGDEKSKLVIATQDGGYLLGGSSNSDSSGAKSQNSRGQRDYWVVKIDIQGNKLWDRRFGGNRDDVLTYVVNTRDGGYLLGGSSESGVSGDKSEQGRGDWDYWIIKIDINGNKLWDKRYGTDYYDGLTAIEVCQDGGYVIGGISSGHSDDKSEEKSGYWILKLDGNGNKIWDKSFEQGRLVSILATNSGGYLLAGYSQSGITEDKTQESKGQQDYWIVKIDANGNKLWDKSFGGERDDILTSVISTRDGAFVLCGQSNSGISGDKTEPTRGENDYWLVKIDGNGNKLWDKRFGGDYDDVLVSVKQLPDESYLLIGNSSSNISGDKSKNSGRVWVVKIDRNATKLWDECYGEYGTDLENTLVIGDANCLFIRNYSTNGSNTYDYLLQKVSFECPTDIDVCRNDSIDLIASGCSGTILWSTGQTGNTLSVNVSTASIITATCIVNGCGSDVSNPLRLLPYRPPVIALVDSCSGDPLRKVFASGCQGVITWSTGQVGDTILINVSYDLYVSATCTINGCVTDNSNLLNLSSREVPAVAIEVANNSAKGIYWDKRYGGNYMERLAAVVVTKDKGYLLGGTSDNYEISGDLSQTSQGGGDYWIIKVDTNGNKLWDRRYGGNSGDELTTMVATNDGGYLLGGNSYSDVSGDKTQVRRGYFDYWIIKVDASGNKLWDKTFGGTGDDFLRTILLTSDGGYLLGGTSFSDISGDKSQGVSGQSDYWLVKIDASGVKVWDKVFGGDGTDFLYTMITTTNGDYVLAGSSNSTISGSQSHSSKGGGDGWLIRINQNGSKIWDKRFGGDGDEYISEVLLTDDGGFLLGGDSFSSISGDKSQLSQGQNDYWLVKLDANGTKIWDKCFGGRDYEFLMSILPTGDGGYMVGGTSYSNISGDKSQAAQGGKDDTDFWLVKIDANGKKVFDKVYGGNRNEYLQRILPTTDGGFLLAGGSSSDISGDKTQNTQGNTRNDDFWIIKTKPRINSDSTTICGNKAVKLIASGCVGIVNWSTGQTGDTIFMSSNQKINVTATCTDSVCVSKNSNAITVNVSPASPSISVNSQSVCLGGNATLTASNCTGQVTWNTGAIGSILTLSNLAVTANYTATCTLGTCTATNTGKVTVSSSSINNSLMTGNWGTPTIWSCGHIPLVTEPVQISEGHTVTLDVNGVAKSVNLLGILNPQTSKILTIQGN